MHVLKRFRICLVCLTLSNRSLQVASSFSCQCRLFKKTKTTRHHLLSFCQRSITCNPCSYKYTVVSVMDGKNERLCHVPLEASFLFLFWNVSTCFDTRCKNRMSSSHTSVRAAFTWNSSSNSRMAACTGVSSASTTPPANFHSPG